MAIRANTFIFGLCLSLLGSVCLARSAVQKGSGFWTDADQKLFLANPKAEIHGNVLSMEEGSGSQEEAGLKLRLATKEGEVTVYVGPSWFLSKNAFNLTQGEPITVVGIRIPLEKMGGVMASEISRSGEKLILREPSGKPRW